MVYRKENLDGTDTRVPAFVVVFSFFVPSVLLHQLRVQVVEEFEHLTDAIFLDECLHTLVVASLSQEQLADRCRYFSLNVEVLILDGPKQSFDPIDVQPGTHQLG